MQKKYIVFVFLAAVVFTFFILNATQANQHIINTPVLPSLPPIGKIEIGKLNFTGYEGRKPDINRMTAQDSLTVTIYDDKGNLYPSEITGRVNLGRQSRSVEVTVPITINIDLQRGDSKVCQSTTFGLRCELGGFNISEGQITIGVPPGNGSHCVYDNGCTFPLDRTDLVRGAPIPGSVTLIKIYAQGYGYIDGEQYSTATGVSYPNLKLFTVADPPKINSLNKISLKQSETVTLTGTSFDSGGAGKYLWANKIFFDLDRDTLRSSRVINNYSGNEDLIHYCTANKVKVDIPSDLPLGKHTLTLYNDFGYSNSYDIDVVNGTGTPENDPACSGTSGKINSISPTTGPAGTTVTVNGSGFNSPTSGASANKVTFNGVEAIIISLNATGTQLQALVPDTATTGRVEVTPAGKFVMIGPTFSVTKGTASVTPTPTCTPGSTEAACLGIGEGTLKIISIFPDEINKNSDNSIVLHGTGFVKPVLTSANPALTFKNIVVSDDGGSVTADVDVAAAAATLATITVTDKGGSDIVDIDLATKLPGSPTIDSAIVSALNEQNEATLTIEGTGLNSATLEIDGIQAIVKNIDSQTDTNITATLEFSIFYSARGSNLFSLIHQAMADTTNRGAAQTTGPLGSDNAPIDAPKPLESAQGKTPNPLAINFKLKNPLAGDAKTIGGLIGILAKFLFNLGMSVSVILILWSGFHMLTSGGNPERYKKGLDILKYAIYGLGILLIAKGFVSLIQSILGITKT